MRVLLVLVSALVVFGFGFWAYHVNYDTQLALRRVADLRRQIAAERTSLAMLKAEWAWLSRPERLQALVERHGPALGLRPLEAAQFGEIAGVPRPTPPEPELEPGWDGLTVADIAVTEVGPGYAGPRPLHRPALVATRVSP